MPRALPARRISRHRLMLHRPPPRRSVSQPVRTSDLVLALLGVVLLGGFALLAAYALTSGMLVP
ncbi:hypothetical protein SAMN05216360_110244 [Methylobacterium phyllostachyos]|uniref:Uncharacterized protein n=1 Tax=Methylobacterium phyllostachyos TaxID=582672 RepID=A0A1H0DP12_9HYPH|nr:hypothetical protein [Methylobacterium phyllostachyos]SDN71987.1 hypothetical protein SAMN05216360_110244 [Methylobacterium phyllostachyos]